MFEIAEEGIMEEMDLAGKEDHLEGILDLLLVIVLFQRHHGGYGLGWQGGPHGGHPR